AIAITTAARTSTRASSHRWDAASARRRTDSVRGLGEDRGSEPDRRSVNSRRIVGEATRGDAMSANGSGPVVIDADRHVCEPVDLWERNLPASMRDVAPRVRFNDKLGTQQLLVEDRVGIPMGLAGLGNAGMKQNENFGNALRYEDMNPAGFDPHERVK